MPRTIVLDGVDLAQVILMKDKATGKVLVQAAYRVKAGNELVKTTPDRSLTFLGSPSKDPQAGDLMSAQEQAAASAAWDAVQAALQRAEL